MLYLCNLLQTGYGPDVSKELEEERNRRVQAENKLKELEEMQRLVNHTRYKHTKFY